VKRILAATVLVASLLAGAPRQATAGEEVRTITVTARRFEFVPPSITLKRGETVRLVVTSEDVTHGFFLRALKIDTDIAPGETRELTVTPQNAGTFTAICHHFCGSGHGNMKLTVVVE
jgi:cytochrome c oxidase subunit 2